MSSPSSSKSNDQDHIEMADNPMNNRSPGSKLNTIGKTDPSSPTSSKKSIGRSSSWSAIANLVKSPPKKIEKPAPITSLGAMAGTINKIKAMSRNINNKSTQEQLSEEMNERPNNPWIFSDHDTWKAIWNIVILFLVMYTVIIIPVNFAFPDLPESPGLDYTIDILFIVDVIATFRTAYTDHNGGEYIYILKREIICLSLLQIHSKPCN